MRTSSALININHGGVGWLAACFGLDDRLVRVGLVFFVVLDSLFSCKHLFSSQRTAPVPPLQSPPNLIENTMIKNLFLLLVLVASTTLAPSVAGELIESERVKEFERRNYTWP